MRRPTALQIEAAALGALVILSLIWGLLG